MKVEQTTFRSDGVNCAARLYWPGAPSKGVTPCVVMANGFSLTQDDGLPAFAERFAGAGMATLTFDFRHLGASGGEPRQLVDLDRQRTDFRAAVSFARGLEGVDAGSIALWGFSAAGGHVIYAAAEDHEIAAVVALCPVTDSIAYIRSVPPHNSLRLAFDTLCNAARLRKLHVPVVGPPGSYAFFTQPEALSGFDAVCGERSLWRNELLPRSVPRAPYLPIRVAHRVRCPLLICLGDRDRMAPHRAGERTARRAPLGELNHYPIDHFGGFLDGDFEHVVADQIEFFSRSLFG